MGSKAALVILTAINLLNYIDRFLIAAVMPAMSTDLNLTNTQAGLIMSAFMFGYFITSPLFGYLADRYKRTHVISIGTFVWSLATGIASLATSSSQIFLSRVVVGVGEASTVSTSQALLSDFFPPEKRNKIIAIFTAAIPVGAALGFILGGFLTHHYGWRNAFLIAGMPGLLLAFTVYLVKEPKRGAFDNLEYKKSTSNLWQDVSELFKNKNYMNTVYGYTAFTFTVGGLASWIPQYLVKVKNIPLTQADTVFGAITVLTGIFGTLYGGWHASHFLKKKPRGDLHFIYILTLISIPLTFACFMVSNSTLFYILIALAEFFLFATQSTVNVVFIETVRVEIKSMAIAFSVFMIHLLGDLISPPAVGKLADIFGLNMGVLLLPVALIPSAFFYRKAYKLISKNSPISQPIR